MKFGQIVWIVDIDRFGMYINPNVYQGRIVESEIVYDGESKTFYTVDCEIFEYNGSHHSEIFKVEENLCFEYKADAVNYTLSLQKENKRLNDLITRDFSIANLTKSLHKLSAFLFILLIFKTVFSSTTSQIPSLAIITYFIFLK